MRQVYLRPSVNVLDAQKYFLICQSQSAILDGSQCQDPDVPFPAIFPVENGRMTFCASSEELVGDSVTIKCAETGDTAYLMTVTAVSPGGSGTCDPGTSPFTVTVSFTPSIPSYCTVTSVVDPSFPDPDACQLP